MLHSTESGDALGRRGFGCRVVVVGLRDDLVDQGAVREVGCGDFGVGLCRGGRIALGQRRQEGLLDRAPEALHLAVRTLDEFCLERGIEVRFQPELVALVIFLLQLDQAVAAGGERGRIVQGQRCLEIRFDHVFRRRQDVGDEVVAEFELVVDGPADLDLSEGVDTGEDHRRQPGCRDKAE